MSTQPDSGFDRDDILVMRPEEAECLAFIRAHPGADGPRLAYADYLESHGRAGWAEFIRIQLHMAIHSGNPSRIAPLEERALQLLPDVLRAMGVGLPELTHEWWLDRPQIDCYLHDAHGPAKRDPHADLDHGEHIICTFQRGMIESLEIGAHAFLAAGGAISDRSIIRELEVMHDGGGIRGDFGLDYRENAMPGPGGRPMSIDHEVLTVLSHILKTHRPTSLFLSDLRTRAPEHICMLLAAPGIRTLEEFVYDFGWVDGAILGAFSECSNLQGVRRLVLGAFGLDDAGLESLAASPHLGNLEELTIRSDDRYDPSDPAKRCGLGWAAVERRFRPLLGSRLLLDVHMKADDDMYDDELFYEE